MAIEVGKIFEGTVTGLAKFGAFVKLSTGETGLCHISEIADDYVKEVADHLKEDQAVKVKVLSVDEKGKISLSNQTSVRKRCIKKSQVTEKQAQTKHSRVDHHAVKTSQVEAVVQVKTDHLATNRKIMEQDVSKNQKTLRAC